jgi:hypothetical protein
VAFLAHLPDAAQGRELPPSNLENLDVAPISLKPQGRNLDRAAKNDIAGFLKRHGIIVARAHAPSFNGSVDDFRARILGAATMA